MGLEMLGTLFLYNMILVHQGPLSSRVRLPVGSDNQGNVMAMLILGSKKPYTAAILMELVLLLHTHGCSLAANHVPREFNQWADDLTHPDFECQSRNSVLTLSLPRLMHLALALAHPSSRDRSWWATLFPLVADLPRPGRYQSVHPFFGSGWVAIGPTQPGVSFRGR